LEIVASFSKGAATGVFIEVVENTTAPPPEGSGAVVH
jgi:hypothetical protein